MSYRLQDAYQRFDLIGARNGGRFREPVRPGRGPAARS
jgi:hypothetical protein